jgi:hypothetical protein
LGTVKKKAGDGLVTNQGRNATRRAWKVFAHAVYTKKAVYAYIYLLLNGKT